jgi:ubiquitin conjugation factor E4 B
MLLQTKQIAMIVPDLSSWIPTNPASGATLEKSSFLGPFFALSPLSPGVPKEFFRDPKNMSPADRQSMAKSMQEALRQYQSQLFRICELIVRSGPGGRRGMLDWFAEVLGTNGKRKALRVDPTTVASDGFMLNVVAVLNKFAEPFIDLQCKKVKDPNPHLPYPLLPWTP